MDWRAVDTVVLEHLDKTFPAAQLEIHHRGESIYSRSFGVLDPETRMRPVDAQTRFDLASVSKLFTVTALMTLVEAKQIGLDESVRDYIPEFSGLRSIGPYPDPMDASAQVTVVPETKAEVDAGQVTVRHLLAHNSGLPAWLPLWKLPARVDRRRAVTESMFSYPIGTRVVYSDIGLMLIGFALERVAGKALDEIIDERVTEPLGLDSVTFGPLACENVAPTEFYAWRGQRHCGEVHDENAYSLGGVAGHAGLFGTAADLAALGDMYLNGGSPLLARETVQEMTRLQSEDGNVRRGLGFALRVSDPEAPSYQLSEGAFGHTGFTGTSLWVDPARALAIACLTNRVYYGRGNADALNAFRVGLHRAIVEVVG